MSHFSFETAVTNILMHIIFIKHTLGHQFSAVSKGAVLRHQQVAKASSNTTCEVWNLSLLHTDSECNLLILAHSKELYASTGTLKCNRFDHIWEIVN